MNRKLFSMAFAAGLMLFTAACSDDETTNNPDPNEGDNTTLTGSITEDVTLTSGKTYRLSGQYIVEEGATLTIEPGVRIEAVYDDNVDYILIKQGARIMAEGTASSPIIMTSEHEEPGAWGGIHICGRAHTNAEGGTGSSEIGGAAYGGNNDSDNSGVLRYVRVEYTGYTFDEEHEANGISFYGVGDGTTVEYCQAYRGSDDGFEFFGGSVNISNMVVTDCSDDSFDWTEGWDGTATNLIATQESEETLGYACDCLIEADNNENNFNATPVSNPTISNALFIGNGTAGNGVHLRRGTHVAMNNVQIYGKGDALHVESEQTENALDGRLSNVRISGTVLSENNIYGNAEFEADGNLTNQTNPYASYADIIADNAWAAGWTRSWGASSDALADGSTLVGEISNDVTLGAGRTYYLSGQYIVREGATLNIEAGVKLIAKYDEIVDYILIEQGAKINAVGTADAPIVMTSERESAGAWGGIHICGRAHTNAESGNGFSEIGNSPYGGNVEDDNSGVLQYVRVEYTGYTFDEEHEANGISFYGVGNGTTVDHCQAYKGSDDGFEFFGGSVNVSNMVVVSCSDDSFDWTEGWNGQGTNLMAYQENASTVGYDCDCLIEADNNGNNNNATPVSHPTLSNLVLVGNNSEAQTHGVRLREGTQVSMDNAQICGKGMPLTVETTGTENALKDGTSTLTNISISADLVSDEGIYTNADFLNGEGNSVNADLSYASLADVIAACPWIEGSWVKE